MQITAPRLPITARLRDLAVLAVDQLWFALAVVLGLVLATWLCAALGLPAPLPVEELLVL